jgi:hypothetical protein
MEEAEEVRPCRASSTTWPLASPEAAPYPGGVSKREELERLSSKELHDRAIRVAERRLDVAFLWQLLKAIPVAEAAAGDLRESEADIAVADLVPLIHDFVHSDEGKLADALRPMYLDYLEKHG